MKPRGIVAFLLGLLFAVGLALGGMTNPAKVKAFLDVAGAWDPSLMFVMGGAVSVYLFFFWGLRPRMARPLFASAFQLPSRRDFDARLLVGAGIFGVGWGLGGVCPGPALAVSTVGGLGGLVFLAAMLVGMVLVPRK